MLAHRSSSYLPRGESRVCEKTGGSLDSEGWPRAKREGPYYSVMTTLFAVVVGALATWIYKIVDSSTTYSMVVSGSMPQHALATQGATGSFEVLSATGTVVGRVGVAVNEPPPSYESLWMLFLPTLMFLAMVYAWLYFSRILIYVNEPPVGEFFSFLLAFSGIVAIAVMAALGDVLYLNRGLLVLLFPVAAWIAKCLQVFFTIRKDKEHPLYRTRKWHMPLPLSWIVVPSVTVISISGVAGILLFATVGIQTVFPSLPDDTDYSKVIAAVVTSIYISRGIWLFSNHMEETENQMKQYKASASAK